MAASDNDFPVARELRAKDRLVMNMAIWFVAFLRRLLWRRSAPLDEIDFGLAYREPWLEKALDDFEKEISGETKATVISFSEVNREARGARSFPKRL